MISKEVQLGVTSADRRRPIEDDEEIDEDEAFNEEDYEKYGSLDFKRKHRGEKAQGRRGKAAQSEALSDEEDDGEGACTAHTVWAPLMQPQRRAAPSGLISMRWAPHLTTRRRSLQRTQATMRRIWGAARRRRSSPLRRRVAWYGSASLQPALSQRTTPVAHAAL